MISGQVSGLTYNYTYDTYGNLRSVSGSKSHTYSYSNSNWRDQLTAFDGQTFTYDSMGNPLSYYNGTRWGFEWEQGRRLSEAVSTSHSASYAYDVNGIRSSKTVDTVTYDYITQNGKVVRQSWTKSGVSPVIDFFYDRDGNPYAMIYDGTLYFYLLNLQGDVIRIIDGTGTSVGLYQYDAWGNILYCTNHDVMNVNPLRYRGYYWDSETGFYYCQSRYYDPAIGRFISPDSFVSTGQGILGYNMYAYCNNDPVNLRDDGGNAPEPTVLDYWAMHKMVQMDIVGDYGYAMEVYVKGSNGRGFLDLFDAEYNQYYEVKSTGAALSAENQMQKYDVASVSSWMFKGYSFAGFAQRGTNISIHGTFTYRKWNVSYEYNAPGLIVYAVTPNEEKQSFSIPAIAPFPSTSTYGKGGTWRPGGSDLRAY